MSPTFSTLTGMTSWWVMVCGNSVQTWPSTRVSSPDAIAWRTGQSGVKAQHSAESVGVSTPWAPSSEKARASASSSSSAPKSACRNARLRESTRSTVSRYGRAAFISRPSTPTSMSWRLSDWTRMRSSLMLCDTHSLSSAAVNTAMSVPTR